MASMDYPGVYIKEVPSGVRTITGVPTAIAAFVGGAPSAPAGKTNEPVQVNSWGDYESRFGGLHPDFPMSYAVEDFFQNGGAQALIVRVGPAAVPAKFQLPLENGTGHLHLMAATAGPWGDSLDISVRHQAQNLFELTIRIPASGGVTEVKEVHQWLSTKSSHARFVTKVLSVDAGESRLLRVDDSGGAVIDSRPLETNVSPPIVIASDGSGLARKNDVLGSEAQKSGMYALLKADIFNLLCIPPLTREKMAASDRAEIYQQALKLCVDRRAMLIVDPEPDWGSTTDQAVQATIDGVAALGLAGNAARNAAVFFPSVRKPDRMRGGAIDTFAPCGVVAGIMARTDDARGVWKAPAGVEASLQNIQDLQLNLNDLENGQLNKLGINCLRTFPVNGRVVWGARTLRGADQLGDEYKYVPVRRLALFIEETLYRSTQWAVFEPNDEPLWAQIRLSLGAFMQTLYRQGAFQGRSPREAYEVKCDKETTTQNDIDRGIVNVWVRFAPLKPAEFVVIRIQQLAGQVQA